MSIIEAAPPIAAPAAPASQPENALDKPAPGPQLERQADGTWAPAQLEPKPEGEGAEGVDAEGKPKVERTPEERERMRMQRAIDRKTKQAAEAKAERDHARAEIERLTRGSTAPNNRVTAADSEPLSLTRAQLRELVTAEASRLAPTLAEQSTEVQRRTGVLQSLAKTWGQERFDEVASDLDDAFGGLVDRSGTPKPAIEAVFEADEPAKVIEYLADPDNLEEAEAIARMTAAQAGKAVAKLEAKLKTTPAKGNPRASNAPVPLEPVRGAGSVSSAPNPSDTKAWIRWRNEQERKGL